MAYMDFSATYRTDVAGVATALRPEAGFSTFSPLEWSVIALARRDRLSALREPGRVARALGGLFGLGSESRLADTRLEALRRVAVHGWHDPRGVPAEERSGFHDAGFSDAQLATMLASIAMSRVDTKRRLAA